MLRYRHAACPIATLSLSQATIAGGGVIPHIHKSLINKVPVPRLHVVHQLRNAWPTSTHLQVLHMLAATYTNSY